jgi:hypothetical protein
VNLMAAIFQCFPGVNQQREIVKTRHYCKNATFSLSGRTVVLRQDRRAPQLAKGFACSPCLGTVFIRNILNQYQCQTLERNYMNMFIGWASTQELKSWS